MSDNSKNEAVPVEAGSQKPYSFAEDPGPATVGTPGPAVSRTGDCVDGTSAPENLGFGAELGTEPLTLGSGRLFSELNAIVHANQRREIESVTDLAARAELVKRFHFRPTCENDRELIRSVDGVSIAGCLVQDLLNEWIPPAQPLLAEAVRNLNQQFKTKYPEQFKRRRRVKPLGQPILDAFAEPTAEVRAVKAATRDPSGVASAEGHDCAAAGTRR